MQYAPIVVFGYNRDVHLKHTLLALQNNIGANNSDVYLYLDGNKNEKDEGSVSAVYQVALEVEKANKFGSFKIIKRDCNYGLAKSVIEGVTEIINQYGKVIVLEDDIITSTDFLMFMNQSLEFYNNNSEIWSISGYTFPLKSLNCIAEDVYIAYRASSWGWGTWKNRWDKIDWEIKDYTKFRFNLFLRNRFNRGGTNMSDMLDRQMANEISSWAIRWCYAQFKENTVSIFPCKSKVCNIGLDGSGTHCTAESIYDAYEFGEHPYELMVPKLNNNIIKEFKKMTSLSLTSRVARFIKHNIL